MSIMSVKIQCKRSLNQGLTDKLKGENTMKGGKEWAGPVFPHPTIEKEHAVSLMLS